MRMANCQRELHLPGEVRKGRRLAVVRGVAPAAPTSARIALGSRGIREMIATLRIKGLDDLGNLRDRIWCRLDMVLGTEAYKLFRIARWDCSLETKYNE